LKPRKTVSKEFNVSLAILYIHVKNEIKGIGISTEDSIILFTPKSINI